MASSPARKGSLPRFIHSRTANTLGLSLLEVLVATFLFVMSAIVIGMVIPRSSQVAVTNRAHAQGSELANTLMQTIAGQPCLTVPATLPAQVADTPNFISNSCDCSLEDFRNLPLDGTSPQATASGITYIQRSCVNVETDVGGTPQPTCGAATSPCMQNIRVNVSWVVGNNTGATNASTMIYGN